MRVNRRADRKRDVSRCEELGIGAYLLKPIKQSELFDAVVMSLGIRRVEDELPDGQLMGDAASLLIGAVPCQICCRVHAPLGSLAKSRGSTSVNMLLMQ